MSEKIFAYGSNMFSARFRDYGVIPDGQGRAALVCGYDLCFNKKSRDGSGKANVKPRTGGEVWGVLYSIPDKHLPVLDRGEGSGYHRLRVPMHRTDPTTTDAWIYIAREPSADPALRPYSWYKRFLVEGAREHGLPIAYIEALERVEASQDRNEQRDREKRAPA